MSEEISLKLAMAPEALARLRRHPLLRSLAGGRRARRQVLTAVYYDTPDRRLAKQRIALRVRGDGKRFVQTLKAPVREQSGLQRLLEFEAEVAGPALDLAQVPDPELAAWLAEPGVGEALGPVFSTSVERRLLTIRLIDSEVEIAFDEGEILAGKSRLPLCEAELELKSGRPERLYQLALTLHEQVRFRLESESKAARGHALAEGSAPRPCLAERLVLPEGCSAGTAFVATMRNCLAQLRGNERAALGGCSDPEVVHQLRVAVRRLRAALSLFRPILAEEPAAFLARELDWLQEELGAARDWDVFALETLAPLRHRLAEESGLGRLNARVTDQRQKSHVAALAALLDRRYTELLLKLELWLEDGGWRLPAEPGAAAAPADRSAYELARAQLARRTRQVLKRGRKRDEADEDSLHELRIAGKKLRYVVEFFRDLLPKGQAKAALESLKALQDCLGSLNDAAVSRHLLREVGEGARRPLDARAEGLVLGWQAARVERDLSHLQEVWKRAKKALAPLAK